MNKQNKNRNPCKFIFKVLFISCWFNNVELNYESPIECNCFYCEICRVKNQNNQQHDLFVVLRNKWRVYLCWGRTRQTIEGFGALIQIFQILLWCKFIISINKSMLFTKIVSQLFVLQDPPNDGIICQNCWQKILHFHRFYIKIQSIHEEISKSKDASDIPLESVKVELDESTLKCDQNVDHHGWSVQSQSMYSDHDDLSSHNSFGISFNYVNILQSTCFYRWYILILNFIFKIHHYWTTQRMNQQRTKHQR